MTLTLELTPEVEALLSAQAMEQGRTPDEVALTIVEASLLSSKMMATPSVVFSPPGRAATHLRARILNEATDDPETISRAQAELDEMKRNMNEERRRSGAQPIF